ncbi:hypothetical protein [Paenibacillus nasutitermitis]|uniref:Uncharacterized protein n=1 Tax=Paenibacillus nasutitermitis TaxID=1652958 RepID=A0A916YZ76_9BACL|nr:hypothetical protein [Paenibacillus nasutitermitis]GGD68175.1 hypothetical protein GCM10010911_27430 [Paenibacillus nasutitermitis]
MMGSWRWNVGLGLFGVVLTFLFSLDSNGLGVSAVRSVYAFIAFFVLAYLFRIVLAAVFREIVTKPVQEPETMDENKGSTVDMSTPDETDQLNEMLRMQLDGNVKTDTDEQVPFQPLTPPKLVSTQNKEPEELAKAIRHLTGG